jgi:hypothetical protein
MYGYILCIAVLIAGAGCDRSSDAVPVRVVDLIDEVGLAEQRPPEGHVAVTSYHAGGATRPAIVVPVPNRITWGLPLPHNGVLHTYAAVDDADGPGGTPPPPVRFRVGISDDRVYEGLTEITLTPEQRGWIELRVDLSGFAGWKWSLFYRPDRKIWRLVLATDAIEHRPTRAAWGSPEVVTDTRSAREFVERRRQKEAELRR